MRYIFEYPRQRRDMSKMIKGIYLISQKWKTENKNRVQSFGFDLSIALCFYT